MNSGREEAHLVRFADARRTPWRNGGGETVELAIHPRGASLGSFAWCVSLAKVTSDGPFSIFSRVDRTLTVLDGEGLLVVTGAGRPVRRLTSVDHPYRFAGEAPCRTRLLGGPVTALNVMVERDSFGCAVNRLDPTRQLSLDVAATTLVVCSEGQVETDVGILDRYDALVLSHGAVINAAPRRGASRALVVSIWRLAKVAAPMSGDTGRSGSVWRGPEGEPGADLSPWPGLGLRASSRD